MGVGKATVISYLFFILRNIKLILPLLYTLFNKNGTSEDALTFSL